MTSEPLSTSSKDVLAAGAALPLSVDMKTVLVLREIELVAYVGLLKGGRRRSGFVVGLYQDVWEGEVGWAYDGSWTVRPWWVQW